MPVAVKKQLQSAELVYNRSSMPKPQSRHPKTFFRALNKSANCGIVGEEKFVVMGTIYRDRVYTPGGPGAEAFAGGAGPPPNGGQLIHTALGGLMISNNCVMTLGKWCSYITIEFARNAIDNSSESSSSDTAAVSAFGNVDATNSKTESDYPKIIQVSGDLPSRTFLVGKYESEYDAKVHMEMVTH